MGPFNYLPLKPGQNSIRLLRVPQSPPDSELIPCRLHTFSLNDAPSYIAFSYPWGKSTQESPISLNDAQFPVRDNVHGLLQEVRRCEKFKGRFLWIDAICIDQKNIEERNHQVGIMRQFYTKATEVLVWLGKSTPNNDMAMLYIANQGKSKDGDIFLEAPVYEKRLNYYKNHEGWTNQEGRAIREFCRNAYWDRIWIIQELMNARQIVVFCGSKSFNWEDFAGFFYSLKGIRILGQLAHKHRHGYEILQSGAAKLVSGKHDWDSRPEIERYGICLSTLIERYRYSECTNPLDKVYGLLGLSRDKLKIDYRKTPETVYNEVLELICKKQITERHKMKNFERLLCSIFSFIPYMHAVVTVEDIVARRARRANINTRRESPFGYSRYYSIIKTPLPTQGDSKAEFSYMPHILRNPGQRSNVINNNLHREDPSIPRTSYSTFWETKYKEDQSKDQGDKRYDRGS